jgi:type IV pilus assembly protein PilM
VPDGAVQNGEVKDPGAVAESLKELWKQGKFRGREVVLGVANQRVVVREVTLPWLPDAKELRASLPFLVQESVPIPLEEAVLDFHTLEEFEKDGKHMIRILLVAAQKDMSRAIVGAADPPRLRPVGLDLIPFAIVRSIGSIDEPSDSSAATGDEAIVDIGADVTSICIHAWGVPRFVRILPSGGRMVTTAVAKSMGVEAGDAERMKRGHLAPEEEHMAGGASAAAADTATSFADDIQSSLEFYLTKMPGSHIARVLLSGGGSRLDGLDTLLQERLPDTEVGRGRAFHRVHADLDLDPEAMADVEPLLAVAVGLALPGMRG